MSRLKPTAIPLSLYIHIPWCVRKCPYCDFNSHTVPDGALSLTLEKSYLHALVEDFKTQLAFVHDRKIHTIFIGGGTPSLISAQGYAWLFEQLRQFVQFDDDIEVTLEANPGTVEHDSFRDYFSTSINRLSIGVQSFNTQHLQQLGRIHSAHNALDAIQTAKHAGFQRINVDLMHGLPEQTVEQAITDLQLAIQYGATHISWYQLTIEPNTVFFRTQPILPAEVVLEEIQELGEQILRDAGFIQYEVSAWRKEGPSRHNLNYWTFGDYLAIGAGAHAKVTQEDGIYRFQKTRLPKHYLQTIPAEHGQWKRVEADELPFEFMMNALRLNEGVSAALYEQRTGLRLKDLDPILDTLRHQALLIDDKNRLACTPKGHLFLNSVLNHFL